MMTTELRSAAVLAALLVTSAVSGGTVAAQAPLTLRAVVEAASQKHPLTEAAKARVTAAEGVRRGAGVLPNPAFTYQVENRRFPGEPSPVGMDAEVSSYATLPLEPFFQRWPRVKAADASVRAAGAEVSAARHAAALDAARAFYRAARAEVGVEATADVLAGLEELVRYNTARAAEGATPEGELVRVRLERDRVATELAMARVELARARAELAPYLGAGQTVGALDWQDGLLAAPALPAADAALAEARRARPELIAGRERVRAASGEVSLQRTMLLRQADALFGTKQVAGTKTLLLGFSVPIPLLDQNRGEVQRATGERRAAEQELAWLEARASAEVEGALAAVRGLGEQLDALGPDFLARAEEARTIALAAYHEGATPLLTVLDASRALADARRTHAELLFLHQQSVLELNVALGREPLGEGH
jgi:cobalt-zinc-cadmium efflux system outer membrane protein